MDKTSLSMSNVLNYKVVAYSGAALCLNGEVGYNEEAFAQQRPDLSVTGEADNVAVDFEMCNRRGNLIIENRVGSFLSFPPRCSRLIVISSGQSTTKAQGRGPEERCHT